MMIFGLLACAVLTPFSPTFWVQWVALAWGAVSSASLGLLRGTLGRWECRHGRDSRNPKDG